MLGTEALPQAPTQRVPQGLSTRGEELPRRMPLSPKTGDVLTGRLTGMQFELGDRIGGGFNTDVFRAEGGFAVKIFKFPQGRGLSDNQVTPEQQEAMIHASLRRNPHIADTHTFDTDRKRNTPFLVMSMAAGGSLKDRIFRGSIPSEEGFSIIEQTARALKAIHDAGFVHRDIKPGNILLTQDGVEITDFGIATIQGAKETYNNVVYGSPSYVAPERFWGERDTPRSDIYGWGLVAYQVLTGELPYYSKDSPANSDRRMAIHAHFHLKPRSFSEVLGAGRTPLHIALEPVVRMALEKNPKHRHRDVRALLRALEKARVQAEALGNQSELTDAQTSAVISNLILEDTQPLGNDDATQFLSRMRGQDRGAHQALETARARDRFEVPESSNSSPRHADLGEDETQNLGTGDNTVWLARDGELTQPLSEEPEAVRLYTQDKAWIDQTGPIDEMTDLVRLFYGRDKHGDLPEELLQIRRHSRRRGPQQPLLVGGAKLAGSAVGAGAAIGAYSLLLAKAVAMIL